MNIYRVMQALDLILNSPFGKAYSFAEDETGQDGLVNTGVWYAHYLLTPFNFLDDGPRLALGIMPPGPLGTWPVWLVHSNASIKVVSASVAELIPGLLVELALDNASFWDDLQGRWGEWREVLLEAHQLLGGEEELFQRVETASTEGVPAGMCARSRSLLPLLHIPGRTQMFDIPQAAQQWWARSSVLPAGLPAVVRVQGSGSRRGMSS